MDTVITWLDVETTGLHSDEASLLEVSAVITDTNLNILDENGYNAVVYYPETIKDFWVATLPEVVVNMHHTTGLWDKLPNGTLLPQVNKELTHYIKQFAPDPRTSWLGGNSISLDRDFLHTYLPDVYNHLHYRSVDVTSIAGPANWWGHGVYEKKRTHSAFDDIRESIEELRWLRDKAFK